MGLKHWYGAQPEIVKAAVVAGVLALLAGIIAGAFELIDTEIAKPTSPQAIASPAGSGVKLATAQPSVTPRAPSPTLSLSAAPSSAPSPSTTCLRKLHITKPVEDAIITNGGNGVIITGTACGLGHDSGWLFDFDPEDGYYYDDYSGSAPSPVVQLSQSGNWQFPDVPIGNQGDQGKRYTITLVLASPSCAALLSSEHQIDGDYKLKSFPAGCSIADKVDVYVTYPP